MPATPPAGWLIWPGAGWEEFEQQGGHVTGVAAARHGLPFIATATPQFGSFEYTATGARRVITDDINGAQVGLDILQRRGVTLCGPMFAGALQGRDQGMEFAAAVPDVTHIYAASAQLETSWSDGHLQPLLDPPEWEVAWHYTDLLKALDGRGGCPTATRTMVSTCGGRTLPICSLIWRPIPTSRSIGSLSRTASLMTSMRSSGHMRRTPTASHEAGVSGRRAPQPRGLLADRILPNVPGTPVRSP